MNTNLSYEDNILKHTISDELLSGNEVGVVGIIEQKSPSRQTLMSIGYVIAKEN